MYNIYKEIQGIKKGTSVDISNLSHQVTPLGLEPRTY